MNNSKSFIKKHSSLNLTQSAKTSVISIGGTAANEYQFYKLKPANIVGYTHEFQIIKKSLPIQPFRRLPFKITANDKAMLQLFMIKFSEVIGIETKSFWSEMVNNFGSHNCSYKIKEAQLEEYIIFELINLGSGTVTLDAIDKLIEIKKKSFWCNSINVDFM
ncbi:hypothetical protein [Pseudoalteromonas phenolica]|uniref:Uncharacterized protein n=1 Tax=Pseudoalteromonas phenolica TaxID=161398 RepID=A0A0S2K1Y1_9GAMM|nr:hypothetical protein [Pseudoalteromonas phenolica]ALO42506.1 hypothetical protein PP2015_2008 [Pseudoalteromonas phenolica]MBE0356394.1 hypothetical protein [Pseudoalteromonas phenolica O-BC30]RXF06258.1 hypothetical protein D9981_01635 [Pseudoalteromonas phenolica O-BC30]